MSRSRVVVIGGGVNGLTAAAYLAKAGRDVHVLERRGVLGGLAAVEEFLPGYMSPGLFHDTSMFSARVADELRLAKHGFAYVEEERPVYGPSADGPDVSLSRDVDTAATDIAALSPKDADAFRAFHAFVKDVAPVFRSLMEEPPPPVSALHGRALLDAASKAWAIKRLGRDTLTELLRVGPMSVADWMTNTFETERLRAFLAGPGVYGAFMGPRSSGSALNLLRHLVLSGRSVAGGTGTIIHGLVRAAEGAGATIRTDAEVSAIDVSNGTTSGVTLATGERIDADTVVSTCDPKTTFFQLLDARAISPAAAHRLRAYRMRGTTALVNLALKRPILFRQQPNKTIPYARTGDTLDSLERAFDAVKYGRWSEEPVLEIFQPHAVTSGIAPEGHAVASILVHFVPHALRTGWQDEHRGALSALVLRTLCRVAEDPSASVVGTEVLAPPDIEERYGVFGGHIHHGEHAVDQLLVRPALDCGRYGTPVGGLFVGGGGTHPGGGLTALPGRCVAKQVLAS